MDVGGYMRNQRKQLGRGTEQVKEPCVFDFNYIPDQPLMREECEPLIDAMLRFDMLGMATHMAVIGSRGSGKTLTLKCLQRLVPQQTNLSIVYANCRHHNTSFKILAHLLNIEARGASLTELFDRFCAGCQGRTVVILDEIDLMSIKDRKREILYLLSRSERPFMVIMLSNSPHVLKELDAATRSSAPSRAATSGRRSSRRVRVRPGSRSWRRRST
jgi:Cdc6-like AAA superfamily ATPase